MENPLTREALQKKRQTQTGAEPRLKLNVAGTNPLTEQTLADKRRRQALDMLVEETSLSKLPSATLAKLPGAMLGITEQPKKRSGAVLIESDPERARVYDDELQKYAGTPGELKRQLRESQARDEELAADWNVELGNPDPTAKMQYLNEKYGGMDTYKKRVAESQTRTEELTAWLQRNRNAMDADKWEQTLYQPDAEEMVARGLDRDALERQMGPGGGNAASLLYAYNALHGEEDGGKASQWTISAGLSPKSTDGDKALAAQLTEKQAKTLAYYIGKGDWDTAERYYYAIADQLSQNAGSTRAEELQGNSGIGRVLGGLGRSVKGGAENYFRNVAQNFTDDALPRPVDYYTSAYMTQWANEQDHTVEKYGYLTAQNLGNQLPSILASYLTSGVLGAAGVTGKAATAITRGAQALSVGGGAAGEAYGQALADGYGKDKARTYSVLIGASEALLENLLSGVGAKVGVTDEILLGKIAHIENGLARVALSGAVRIGSEEIEENLQNYLDPLFREILFGEEYQAPSAQETIETTVVTALTTLLLGGGDIANDILDARSDAKTRKAEAAGQMDGTALLQQAAEEAAKRGKVTNSTAENILNNDTALSALTEQADLLLTDGMSLAQQRNAVKEAVARLGAAQENAVQQVDGTTPPAAETRQRAVSEPMRAEDNIRLAQRAAASLGENGAKAFQAAYDTATAEALDPAEAYKGFAQAYNAALKGEEYTAENLPAHMAAAARASGANDRAAAAQAKYFKDAGLVQDAYTKRANLSSKTQNTLDALGKTLGVRIRFAEQVDGGRANGSYSNGEITVALDADDPYSVVVSHETVHRIREAAPEAYQRLENYVRENLGSEALTSSAIYRGDKLYNSTDMDAMTEETVADAFARILGEKDGLHDLVQSDRTLGQKLRDVIHDILVKIREILGKGSRAQLTEKQRAEFRALESDLEGMEKVLAGAIEEVGANKNAAQEGGGKRYSIKEIVGDDSKSYGVGVYLDSALLENLTSKERTQMVKERVKELGGEIFTAYDDAGNAVDISVAKPGARFKNRNGRMVPVNKDLTMKYIGNETKQEAVVLLDELIETASFDESRASLYSHGWLDNNGKNNWDYWATYIQDKNGTIWRATLNLANTVDGEKILYDINPIKKVGQSVKSDTSLPQTSVAQNIENVNRKFSLKEYTDEEKRQHVKDAVDYFGSTSSWNETGYITTDGKRLDFSGRHEGGPGGYRTVDHLDIADALGDGYGGEDYSGAMVQFMAEGNIRISPESGGINLSVMPTKAQMDTLYDFISREHGEVILDLDNTDGRTVSSTEYPTGTSANKVLGDIRAYFEEGRQPYVSELSRFRYSLKEDSQGRSLTEAQREYFRDSKVVDEDGRLLPVYHATDETFTVFDRDKLGALTDGNATDENWAATSHIGFWFNTEDLSRQGKLGTRAEEVYLNLTDPYQADSMEALAAQMEQYSGTPKEKGETFARWLKGEGYDGVVVRDEEFGGTSYIALEPEQIKQTTNQNPTGDPDTRYSLKDTGDTEDLVRLNEENALLRDLVKRWKVTLDKQEQQIGKLKGEMKRTEQISMDREQLAKAARRLAKDYSAKADVSADLESLYNFMLRGGEEFTYTEARERAMGIAEELVNSAVEIDRTLYESYEDLRRELRGVRLNVGDNALGQYESVKELRQAMYGKLNVAKGERSNIDDVYRQLNAKWGEFFPESIINPEDQIERIVDVAQALYTATEYNPFSSDMNSAVRSAANDILERFFDLPQTKKTFADRQAAKLEAAQAKGRERVRQAIERERGKRDDALAKMKTLYETREANAKENLSSAALRDKITRHAAALSKKLLKPTDRQHIPEGLRGAVAAVLDSINLESTFSYDPETGSRIAGTGGLPTGRTAAFRELAAQYRAILDGRTEADVVEDQDLLASLDEIAAMKDTPIANMSTEQLTTIWNTLRAVENMVSSANKLFVRGRFEQVDQLAGAIKDQTGRIQDKREPDGGNIPSAVLRAGEHLVTLDMLEPVTYFERLGPGGKAISDALFGAEGEQTKILAEAAKRTADMVTPEQIRAWEKETHKIRMGTREVELTTAQIMNLYVLNKREQARGHIYDGGIKPQGKNTAAIKVDRAQVANILRVLTAEQLAAADKMQAYLSNEIAAYGNRASMQVYGYEKFTERDYWPISVDKTTVRSSVQQTGAVTSVRNKGMTKATVDKAGNPLVLDSIFDSYTNHITEMAQYAAFLAPMEDAERVLNYQFRDEYGVRTGETVKGELNRIYGSKGSAYFLNLLQDFSQGTKGKKDTGYASDTLSSAYKASAIGANIRVILQQPTSAFRAMDLIEPKYWAKGMARGGGWAKAVEWAPIATWKDWGYFELNTGRSMKEILTGASTKLERVKQGAMSLAGKADNFTWGRLWNACEEQIAGTTELPRGTNLFYEATAELFNEVINKTQVVDSVMHRSQMMRSQNQVNRMAASFMSEPTKVYNMFARRVFALTDAQTQGQRTAAAKALGRTTLGVLASISANALAQALIDAMRDDDRDKKYGEKLAESWGENFLDGLNPMQYVPYLKDVVSLLDGYDVGRMDMEAIGKTIQAVQTAYKSIFGNAGKQSRANALANLFAQAARLLGLPVYNLKRDVLAVLSTAAVETDSAWAMWQMDRLLLNPGNNPKTFYDDLYRARGDEKLYRRIYNWMESKGFSPDALERAMRERYKEEKKDDKDYKGDVTSAEDAMAGLYPTAQEKSAPTFDMDSLSNEQQAAYYDTWKSTYTGVTGSQSAEKGLARMTDEEQTELMKLARTFAAETAKGAAVEDYEPSAGWISWASDGASYGVDETEAILFKLAYEMSVSDKDRDGKVISGSKKENTLEKAKQIMPWLTKRELAYLQGGFWK